MKRSTHLLAARALSAASASVFAAGADLGQAVKQPTNWTAISMFGVFVVGTLFITKWAASEDQDRPPTSTPPAAASPASRTAWRSPATTCRPRRSSASRRRSMASGYDGLIYSIGFLVGWPIITFLMAERLRNLGTLHLRRRGRFRFKQTPMRVFAASGTLVVVAFYLIAQMVGAGQLIKLLFGLEYWIAVVIVGALMMVYVLFGGMTATTWVQIIKAVPAARRRYASWRSWCCAQLRLQPRGAVRQGGRGEDRLATDGKSPTTPRRPLDHGAGQLHQGSDLGDLASAWR